MWCRHNFQEKKPNIQQDVSCGRSLAGSSARRKWSQQKKVFFRRQRFRPLSHVRKKVLLAEELRLQPPAPKHNNIVYPKAIYAIQTYWWLEN